MEEADLAIGLERLRAGRAGATGLLCAELRPEVQAFVTRRLSEQVRRWEEPADLTHRILLELQHNLDDFPTSGSPEDLRRWAFRIATLRIKDARRKHRRLRGESAAPSTAPESPTPSSGPVTAADRLRFLEELVARLPERYSEVVRLCALEGLDCSQAAARLGLKPDTVQKRYRAARRALRERLGSPTRV